MEQATCPMFRVCWGLGKTFLQIVFKMQILTIIFENSFYDISHQRYRKKLYLLNHVDPFQSYKFRVNNIYITDNIYIGEEVNYYKWLLSSWQRSDRAIIIFKRLLGN